MLKRVRSVLFGASIVLSLMYLSSGCMDEGSMITPELTPVVAGPDSVSFIRDIKPIFDRAGCTSCHGGNGGLYVSTVALIRQGGIHGPAVIPGDAANSILAQKISATPPFGDRMPQGGPYLPDSVQQVIRQWINQGALDN